MENENQKIPDGTNDSKKKTSDYVDTDKYLSSCKTALKNASDPSIEPLLTKRGYTPDIIAEKLVELDKVTDLVNKQQKEYGEQYEATEGYTEVIDDLGDDFNDHVGFARAVFEDNVSALTALGLRGRRSRTQSGYAAQGVQFYKGILDNSSYIDAMANIGVELDELKEMLLKFQKLADLTSIKTKETGEAQIATKARDAALHAFEKWFSKFKKVGKIALRKFPQLREKLGWLER